MAVHLGQTTSAEHLHGPQFRHKVVSPLMQEHLKQGQLHAVVAPQQVQMGSPLGHFVQVPVMRPQPYDELAQVQAHQLGFQPDHINAHANQFHAPSSKSAVKRMMQQRAVPSNAHSHEQLAASTQHINPSAFVIPGFQSRMQSTKQQNFAAFGNHRSAKAYHASTGLRSDTNCKLPSQETNLMALGHSSASANIFRPALSQKSYTNAPNQRAYSSSEQLKLGQPRDQTSQRSRLASKEKHSSHTPGDRTFGSTGQRASTPEHALASILTVSILEAELKVDKSGFLAKMSVYAQVTLQTLGLPQSEKAQNERGKSPDGPERGATPLVIESATRNTQSATGKKPKWNECFVFELGGREAGNASEYLLEISVWSQNYLVSATCMGRAFLKFEASHRESGCITNWLTLKDEQQQSQGEVFVSISKEAVQTGAKPGQKQFYEHVVQSTLECASMAGDTDEHAELLHSEQRSRTRAAGGVPRASSHAHNAKRPSGQSNLRRPVLARLRDESEVNSAEDELERNGDEPQEEGLDSPIDDIQLEQEQNMQPPSMLYLGQVREQNRAFQLQQQYAHDFYNQQLLQAEGNAAFYDGAHEQYSEIEEAEERLRQLVGQDPSLQSSSAKTPPKKQSKSRNPAPHIVQEQLSQLQQKLVYAPIQNSHTHELQYAVEPSLLFRTGNQQMQARLHQLYHTGGFSLNAGKQATDRMSSGSDPDPDLRDGFFTHAPGQAEVLSSKELTSEQLAVAGAAKSEDAFSGEDETCLGQPEMQLIDPTLLMQVHPHAAAEELADLQHDMVEENSRLRAEVKRIDKMFKKIEARNKQLKQERSHLKILKEKLRSKSKRVREQQDELEYKRQQIEKENIKVNKSIQKVRRVKQQLEQALSLVQSLAQGEIFAKLRYEASLLESDNVNTGADTSEDLVLAMQAHEFVAAFEKIFQLMKQVASDSLLQGGATGSGDLNGKLQPHNAANTVQTTQTNFQQHHAQNSQSSIQTASALSRRPELDAHKSHQNMESAAMPSKFHLPESDGKAVIQSQDLLQQQLRRENTENVSNSAIILPKAAYQQADPSFEKATSAQAAYQAHSSIREIHAHGQHMLLAGQQNEMNQSQSKIMDESTPHLNANAPQFTHQNFHFGHISRIDNGDRRASSSSVPPQHPRNYKPAERSAFSSKTAPSQAIDQKSRVTHAEPGEGSVITSPAKRDRVDLPLPNAKELYAKHLDAELNQGELATQFTVQAQIALQPGNELSANYATSDKLESSAISGKAHAVFKPQHCQSQTPEPVTGSLLQSSAQLANKPELATSKQVTENSPRHSPKILQIVQAAPFVGHEKLESLDGQTVDEHTAGGREAEAHYAELIGQMSRELTDIQAIKHNLLRMQTEQEMRMMHQVQAQVHSPAYLEPDQNPVVYQQSSAEDDGDIVEGYIWESMQRNAQRMQSIKAAKGIQDPAELEKELLRDFQTNGRPLPLQDGTDLTGEPGQEANVSAEAQSLHPKEGRNADECKFTSSFVAVHDAHGYAPAQAPLEEAELGAEPDPSQEDELEFKFDPDFLSKINANMAMNDQILEQRRQEQERLESDQQVAPQLEQFQQSTLQGEQAMPFTAGQDQTSFISSEREEDQEDQEDQEGRANQERLTSEVDDGGPSFILDHSAINNERQSQLTRAEAPGQSSYLAALQSMSRHVEPPRCAASPDQDLTQLQQLDSSAPKVLPQLVLEQAALPSSRSSSIVLTQTHASPVKEPLKAADEDSNSVIKLGEDDIEPEADLDSEGVQDRQNGAHSLLQKQQLTPNDFQISNRSSVQAFANNDAEDEISKLINESYQDQNDPRNLSVIYKDNKLFDQPKKAVYGIQPAKTPSNF